MKAPKFIREYLARRAWERYRHNAFRYLMNNGSLPLETTKALSFLRKEFDLPSTWNPK